jgi:hypothetical protein
MLLTQKTQHKFIPETTDRKDLYRNEWKRVQALASMFWSRWRKEYLPQLQQRQKWTDSQRDLRNGNLVLLKDKSICRTQWPIGRIVNAIKNSDDHVRKVEVRIIVNGKPTVYTRPISELILLVEEVFV